ncbi:hypothetical protein HK096_008313, partial [Nowakowskiella sp. JEL0078]
LKSLGNDFVFGFIQSIDSEKDPRNLMICFRLVTLITTYLDFKKYSEDLFDTIFCYFPITFRPPPDDVYGITAEDLKKALRSVLASTPVFGIFAMPSILEKLSSTSRNAKESAMDLIAASAPVYGYLVISPHIETLWDILSEEVFEADEHCQDLPLSAIHAVALSLTSKYESRVKLISLLTTSLKNILESTPKKTKTFSKILFSIASVSDSYVEIISESMPFFLLKLRQETDTEKRLAILDVLLSLFMANKSLTESSDKKLADTQTKPLESFVIPVFEAIKNIILSQNANLDLCACSINIIVEILSADLLSGYN